MEHVVRMLMGMSLLTVLHACAEEEGDPGQSRPEWLACSSAALVGTVVRVEHPTDDDESASIPPFDSAPDPRIFVVVDVQDWIKPTVGQSRVELDIVDPALFSGEPLDEGLRALFVVPLDPAKEAGILHGRRIVNLERKLLADALPKSETLDCPGA